MVDSGGSGRTSRRRILKTLGAGSVVGLAGCTGIGDGGGASPGSRVSDVDTSDRDAVYGEYDDVEVDFATSSLYTNIWQDLAGQYEQDTGLTVNVSSYAQSEMQGTLLNQLRSEQTSFDMWISDVIWTGSFMEPEFAEPLQAYLDSSLTAPDYAYDDHLDIFATNYGKWPGPDGTVYGLPWYGDIMKLVVRKDVLEEHADAYESEHGESIMPSFPQGYESYEKFNRVAAFMSDQGWPMGLEGRRGWNIVYYYPNRFSAITGEREMLTGDKQSKLGTSGAKEALQVFVDQTEWAMNPLSSGYTQSRDQFLNGDTWAVEQWGTATAKFIDEYGWEEGVRVTLTPGGYPNLGGWGVLLNSFSSQAKKDAAFLFAQWATSKQFDKYAMREHGVTPTRSSSFTDQLKEQAPQLRYHDPETNPGMRTPSLRPRVPQYQELNDTMSGRFSQALSGSLSVEETITTVHQEWQSALSEN